MPPKPPTDKPELASYECPAYVKMKPIWQEVSEIFAGSLNKLPVERAMYYLPKEVDEGKAYAGRLSRSVFDNRYKGVVLGYAGAFRNFEPVDILPEFEGVQEDVDCRGGTWQSFLDAADTLALVDKYCFVLVTFPRVDTPPRNRSEEIKLSLRPQLKLVHAHQAPNYLLGSKGEILQITLIEEHVKEVKKFGAEVETLYRVVTPGRWELIRVAQDKSSGKWSNQRVDSGTYDGVNGEPLPVVPLIPYSLTHSRWWGEDRPPLYNVAEMNVRLYQSESDFWELLRKLSLPALWVAPGQGSQFEVDETGESQDLSIGPNSFTNLGEGGRMGFSEPSGSSLQQHAQEIERSEQKIRRLSLEFITGTDNTRTATEVRLDFSAVKANLDRMGGNKESAVGHTLSVFALFVGGDPLNAGGIQVSTDIGGLLFTVQDVALAFGGGFLSLESAVRRMEEMGYTENAEEELRRIIQEKEAEVRQVVRSLAPGELPEDEDDAIEVP